MEEIPESSYNAMQTVKRRFFAMRNGVVADALRKGGSPFRIIFGLNLPQLVEIAADTGTDDTLGQALWDNSTTRESMLLAPMLMSHQAFTRQRAQQWIAAIPSAEVADILCHKLLRFEPYAVELAESLAGSESEMERYVAVRLMFNLVSAAPARALEVSRAVSARPSALTAGVAAMLAEEADFVLNG